MGRETLCRFSGSHFKLRVPVRAPPAVALVCVDQKGRDCKMQKPSIVCVHALRFQVVSLLGWARGLSWQELLCLCCLVEACAETPLGWKHLSEPSHSRPAPLPCAATQFLFLIRRAWLMVQAGNVETPPEKWDLSS